VLPAISECDRVEAASSNNRQSSRWYVVHTVVVAPSAMAVHDHPRRSAEQFALAALAVLRKLICKVMAAVRSLCCVQAFAVVLATSAAGVLATMRRSAKHPR
jgi:hypothetical protein